MAIFLSRIKKVLNLGTKSITSNGTYNASSDGYDGYSQVTVNVSGGGGTSITPSNASPVALTANNTVTPTAAGYAIESYNSVTPSNASPVALTSGDIDKMGGAGYAIASYDSKTPSDSTPPTVSSGDIVKMGGAGYLYATQQSAGAKRGTTPAMSNGDTYEIDTGLSSISQFMWFATTTANNMQNVLTYDSAMGAYFTGCCPANFGGYFKRAIGPNSAAASYPGITVLTGGKITIKTSTSYGAVQAGYWFAQ